VQDAVDAPRRSACATPSGAPARRFAAAEDTTLGDRAPGGDLGQRLALAEGDAERMVARLQRGAD